VPRSKKGLYVAHQIGAASIQKEIAAAGLEGRGGGRKMKENLRPLKKILSKKKAGTVEGTQP